MVVHTCNSALRMMKWEGAKSLRPAWAARQVQDKPQQGGRREGEQKKE